MVASVFEALWYLRQDPETFAAHFNSGLEEPLMGSANSKTSPPRAAQVPNIAQAVRELDKLREDGLITEFEFEQKRRALLGHIR